MCSHYQGIKEQQRYQKYFGTPAPIEPGKVDLWPGYLGSFIRRHTHSDVGDDAVPELEAVNGLFGLVPHWSTDTKLTKSTYNARSETVADKPSFRDAWRKGQHCIIPAEAIYEPDWRSGKAIATRIEAANGEPMGIAGLWSSWKSPKGEVLSYTMLTVNADSHPLMKQFHKPTDEKRMVVVLQRERYRDWLNARVEHSMEFMVPYLGLDLCAVDPAAHTSSEPPSNTSSSPTPTTPSLFA
jgi:putative SOS response-associated peptidase YedK